MAALWQAITVMFDHDRSATRGELALCGLHVFSHPNAYGVQPAKALTSRLTLTRDDPEKAPRALTDYHRHWADTPLTDGIELTSIVDLWP